MNSQVLIALLWGMALGIVLSEGIRMFIGEVLSNRRPRCKHSRLEVHSTERYSNTTYLHAVCLICGTAVKFNLGYTSASLDAQMRAAKASLEGNGYHHEGDNTFQRDEE